MGDLISLAGRQARLAKPPPPGAGKILLFTGVRYERMTEELEQPRENFDEVPGEGPRKDIGHSRTRGAAGPFDNRDFCADRDAGPAP